MKRTKTVDVSALRARGLDVTERGVRLDAMPRDKRASKRELVPNAYVGCQGNWLAWQIGVEVVSEANLRSRHERSARAAAQKRAVMAFLAPDWKIWGPAGDHCRAGKPLLVRLTRIGGKRLDRVNLMVAFKAVEDAVAALLGCNDGSPFWLLECEQCSADGVGIRIEFERRDAV